jgi:metallo-beta-lactamase family protein
MIKKIFNKFRNRIEVVGKDLNVKVTCVGGAEMVTGSNFLIEFEDKKILIDCGLPQGLDSRHEDIWKPFSYDASKINFLLVTHAHLDHIGKIPFLVKQGFSGRIISTKATREIARESMFDTYNVLVNEFIKKGLVDSIPYSGEEVEVSLGLWHHLEYRDGLEISPGVSIKFFNSEHILGSALIQLNIHGKKILFTGDMGSNSILLEPADIPTDSDYVFMETVYGNRVHPQLADRKKNLELAIEDVIRDRGTMVIPAFSIERTQEILSEINDFVEERQIPVIPVYLDSPLAISITHVFYRFKNLLNQAMQAKMKRGDDVFNFPGLHFTHTRDESIHINDIKGPKIVIAGSGMLAGGRVMHHVQQYIEKPYNTILFVGYQATGTLGRKIQSGEKRIQLHGFEMNVRAQITTISGYSAHRDQNSLLDFVNVVKNKAKKIFLILGDGESLEGFQSKVKEVYGVDTHICRDQEVIEL